MKPLIEQIVRALVDAPDEVSVRENGDLLELRVAPSDLGRVIGRQGRTARSLRAILAAASSKTNRRWSLEILE